MITNNFQPGPDDNGELTVQDHFAAAALQGMLANPQYMQFASNVHAAEPAHINGWLAEKAYRLAHAMLVERDK